MARSGSQSLRAMQLGSRRSVRIRISGILNALTWSTRETPDLAGIQSSARPKAAASATEDSLVTWRTHIGDDVIQDMDGSAKSFSSVTQAMRSIKLR